MASSSTQRLKPVDLRPHLIRCGYDDERQSQAYRFDGSTVPLACFSSGTHDSRSACIAVIEAESNIESEVAEVRETGAPVVFVCAGARLEWWKQTSSSPVRIDTVISANVPNLFKERREQLKPGSIYEAKTRGRLSGPHQLDFVDVGLMPLVEGRAGKKLSDLLTRALGRIRDVLGSQVSAAATVNDLYKSAFWLVAAKMLRDKKVPNFKKLDLSNIDEVFGRVGRHYGDTDGLPPGGKRWRPAIEAAAAVVAQFSHLGNVSTEALAHVYENTGVPKELRKALGIHSTPSALIDYMVWQLWPWIAEIPEVRRHVFEPACGHAGFLVAMLRQLSQWSSISDGEERHKYLRKHLHGLEYDPFALEVAKLSLTLADIPHGNSWDLKQGDMFEGKALATEASRAMVLLANPPYEPFTQADRSKYGASSKTKACELVKRTLSHLQQGACFGIVVPAGFLHSSEAQALRGDLLTRFELAEIAVFEDKLFEHGEHEVVVLIGRRSAPKAVSPPVTFKRARNKDIQAFQEAFRFTSVLRADLSKYAAAPEHDMRVPELATLWRFLGKSPTLGSFAVVGQGLSFRSETEIGKDGWKGKEAGFHTVGQGLKIWQVPRLQGMNLSPEALKSPRYGMPSGHPQVLFNYAPVSRGAWRLKAVWDGQGRAFTSGFVCVRPNAAGVPDMPIACWAILNSPIANAFAYSKLGKRHNIVGTMRKLPMPHRLTEHAGRIVEAAQHYRELASSDGPVFGQTATPAKLRHALLAMDAAVLRAYDLPPKLERELLDFFEGEERTGVGVPFTSYYPPDMKAFIPLHELVSEEYARSTAGALRGRHKPVTDKRILAALKVAAESFGEE